jgi:hypothetical protein
MTDETDRRASKVEAIAVLSKAAREDLLNAVILMLADGVVAESKLKAIRQYVEDHPDEFYFTDDGKIGAYAPQQPGPGKH